MKTREIKMREREIKEEEERRQKKCKPKPGTLECCSFLYDRSQLLCISFYVFKCTLVRVSGCLDETWEERRRRGGRK